LGSFAILPIEMSFAEIKAELPKLTPEERIALARELDLLRDFNDPAFVAEITRRNRETERGENVMTDDEFRAHLQALGRGL
jgi:hypothetical protein